MEAAKPIALVIGAGIGGLGAAVRLAVKGYQVTIFEAGPAAGGKLAELRLGPYRWDAGPSLYTLPEQVDALYQLAGRNPAVYYQYDRLAEACRYFYPDGTRLIAPADVEGLAQAIENATGEPAAHVRQHLARAAQIDRLTRHVFLERSLHRASTYLRWPTLGSAVQLYRIDALRTVHQANAARFHDARVVQLFDRYATYNGSDPYRAPATLNVIPHLEYHLGAYLPRGGMYRIVEGLVRLLAELGVRFRYRTPVEEILYSQGKVTGIRACGHAYPAQVVVTNADVAQTYPRLLPTLPPPQQQLTQERSTSAVVFYWGMRGSFPELGLHNVFFSKDYAGEFAGLFGKGPFAQDPTIYLNISSKHTEGDAPVGHENWFVMINAPADSSAEWPKILPRLRQQLLAKLGQALGTDLAPRIEAEEVLTPSLLEQRTGSVGGALYGTASNSLWAAFMRHPNQSRRLRGMYFVGGSVHPGGGIPLSLLSAKIALEDLPHTKSA